MRALVVYCHPKPESFNAAVLHRVLDKLTAAGAEIRVRDLYASGFNPVLSAEELDEYLDCSKNTQPVQEDVDGILWCDTVIFVYPTWWYGLPAMLKGWLDRVLLPNVAFVMPCDEFKDIHPGLGHITRFALFTTCGASRLLTSIIGAPGRRTLLRGMGLLCARHCRKVFAAHYLMDSSTPESRAAHLNRVDASMDKLLKPLPKGRLRSPHPRRGDVDVAHRRYHAGAG
ncbi:MAG: NAD(P)H-dependent oxidoreductase [Pseudomonadota bacterium]